MFRLKLAGAKDLHHQTVLQLPLLPPTRSVGRLWSVYTVVQQLVYRIATTVQILPRPQAAGLNSLRMRAVRFSYRTIVVVMAGD